MTVFYEGGGVKTKLTGKEIIAEMKTRTDPVHWKIMARLQDACTHDYPKIPVVRHVSGAQIEEQLCCGCSRTPSEIGARKLFLAAAVEEPVKTYTPPKGEWIG